MKHLLDGLLLTLTATFLLAGCGGKTVDNDYLVQIDSLLVREGADSAQRVIEQVQPTMLTSERNEAYYILLREEVAYLKRLPASTDSLINRCIAYYEKSGDEREKLMEAYFYKADIQQKLTDYPSAILTLKQCESMAMELHDQKMQCRVYSYIALINIVSGEYDLAMQYARQYLSCSMGLEDKLWRAFALNQIASIFGYKNQMDSCILYINKCVPLLDKSTEKFGYATIYSNVGNFNAEQNPDFALKYLETALRLQPSCGVYSSMALIYARKGDERKADSLWAEGIKIGSYNEKVLLAQTVVDHKKEIGDTEAAGEYAVKQIEWQDSLEAKQKADRVDRVQAKYEFDKKAEVKDLRIEKLTALTGLIVVIIGIVAYAAKKRRKRESSRYSSEIASLKKQDQEITQRTNEQKKYIERLSEDRHESIDQGQRLYEALKGGETIVMWQEDDFENFFTYYFTLDSDFMGSLNAGYEKLSSLMKLYLILTHEGWETKAIADTLGVKPASLRVMKKRISDKKKAAAGGV